MNTTILTTILYQTRTTREADVLIQTIDRLLRDLYHLKHEALSSVLSLQLPPHLRDATLSTMNEQRLNASDPEACKAFFTSLREAIILSHVITLNIAYSPPDEQITVFAMKAKELFGVSTLLEVNVQDSLVAGALIIANGKYIDISLKKKIDAVFSTHQQEFREILNGSPRQ